MKSPAKSRTPANTTNGQARTKRSTIAVLKGSISESRSPSLVLTLLDTDIRDDLHVRLFVDYNAPDRLPPRAACEVPHNDTNPQAMRTATCNVSGLCMTADIGVQRSLTIVVSDRLPMDFGADPQALMMPGQSSYRFYFLRCQPPQTP